LRLQQNKQLKILVSFNIKLIAQNANSLVSLPIAHLLR